MEIFVIVFIILMMIALINQERINKEKKELAKRDLFDDIQDLVNSGHFDRARDVLYKTANKRIDVHTNPYLRLRLTDFISRFVHVDPLYQRVMEQARQIIADNPGVLQSKLYSGEEKVIKDNIKYILYFAEQLGEVRRIKSGNNYKLYIKGYVDPTNYLS